MINRNLLIGFGLGLIFSAGFLSVFPAATPSMNLTKEQLEAYAKSENYVLLPKEQYEELKKGKEQNNQAPTKPTSPTKPSAPKGPQQVSPPTTGVQPGQTTPPTGTQAPSGTVPPAAAVPPSPSAPKSPTVPTAPQEIVTVTIPYKATAKSVASLFVQAGLLPPNNNFIATLNEQNKLNRIRVGTYKIPKGTSTEKIIQIITTPPVQ